MVDPVNNHESLIKDFEDELNKKLYNKARSDIAERFGNEAIFKAISKLEKRAMKKYDENINKSLVGFEEAITIGERDLSYNIRNKDEKVTIDQFYKSLEIYLRLKFFTNRYVDKLIIQNKLNNKKIEDYTFSTLKNILERSSNFEYIFNKPFASGKNKEREYCTKNLSLLKVDRNGEIHSSQPMPLPVAVNKVQLICETIVKLEKMMLN